MRTCNTYACDHLSIISYIFRMRKLTCIYVDGSTRSETNPMPEYGFILCDPIMIPRIEASVPDRINAHRDWFMMSSHTRVDHVTPYTATRRKH